ncbi:MAG: hypothetical protein NTX48_04095 [Planctomycetales bacterium]|nr:hypothetical protein [Planctomycetales bacterium]
MAKQSPDSLGAARILKLPAYANTQARHSIAPAGFAARIAS